MQVCLSGASGLVGQAVAARLRSQGDQVIPLVRQAASEQEIAWDIDQQTIDRERLEAVDAVVHLAGENIATGRWNQAKKARIRDSRVQGTELLATTLASLAKPPKVLVCAAAIGYYGDRGDEQLAETSAPGTGFLSQVCQAWEAASEPAAEVGIRVVRLRIGVVLSPQGGALAKMLTPFRLGLGGRVGSGQQYWSWVTLPDLTGIVQHAIACESLHGSINAVAPGHVTNLEFTQALGRVLRRPTWFPMPALMVRLLLGEMGEELLLSSTRVLPQQLEQSDYQFQHPSLEPALHALLDG